MQTLSTTPRLCQADGHEQAREAALAEFDRQLENLRACVHWLIAAGVAILDADLRRGRARPVVTVAASPYLPVLFQADCANTGRRQEGSLTIFTWQAVRFGIVVKWEEACVA